MTPFSGFCYLFPVSHKRAIEQSDARFQLVMTDATYVTKEGLEKLQAELFELKKHRRPDLISRLETAKALGDLSENAEYHEAKDALAFAEGRIRELELMLNDVRIIEDAASGGAIMIGSTIEVEANGNRKTYQIVGSTEANPVAGRISNESPLGAAFIGKKKGDEVPVEAPNGRVIYTIVDVK